MEQDKRIKVFIVDDHDLFREGVKYVLLKEEKFQFIGEAANGIGFLEKLQSSNPDVVLMDIDMPLMNGADATMKALEISPQLKIICLSMHGDQGHYQKMIECGVKGFVLKDAGILQLKNAIVDVAQGRNFFSQELLMSIILNKEKHPLGEKLRINLEISDRELDVLRLLCQGSTNKEIAESLFVSPKTVEGHKAKLMLKTNSVNSLSLVLFAIKNRLVEL